MAGDGRHDDFDVRRKFEQGLAAAAAGGDGLGEVADDGDLGEGAVAGGQGGEEGGAFGAAAEDRGRAFDVAPGDDEAIGGAERCTNLDASEWGHRVGARGLRGRDECFHVRVH